MISVQVKDSVYKKDITLTVGQRFYFNDHTNEYICEVFFACDDYAAVEIVQCLKGCLIFGDVKRRGMSLSSQRMTSDNYWYLPGQDAP